MLTRKDRLCIANRTKAVGETHCVNAHVVGNRGSKPQHELGTLDEAIEASIVVARCEEVTSSAQRELLLCPQVRRIEVLTVWEKGLISRERVPEFATPSPFLVVEKAKANGLGIDFMNDLDQAGTHADAGRQFHCALVAVVFVVVFSLNWVGKAKRRPAIGPVLVVAVLLLAKASRVVVDSGFRVRADGRRRLAVCGGAFSGIENQSIAEGV